MKNQLWTMIVIIIILISCNKEALLQKNNDNPAPSASLKSASVKEKLNSPSATAVVNAATVTITWQAVSNVSGYHVVYTCDNGGTPPSEVNIATTSVTLNNLPPANYTVKVKALAPQGNTKYQDSDFGTAIPFTVAATVTKTKLPSPIVNVVVSYSAPTAGVVTANPAEIWPPNNKELNVTFSGSVTTGTGGANVSWNPIANASGYSLSFGTTTSPATPPTALPNLAPGNYNVTVVAKADPSSSYLDSDPATVNFAVLPGSASYKLVDEYSLYSYSGSLTGSYSLPLTLMASRLGTDMDGRNYSFVVTSTNGAGIVATSTGTSVVPHDKRK